MVFLFTRKVGFAEKFPTICLDISNAFFFVYRHKTNATSFIHLHVAEFEITNETLDKKVSSEKVQEKVANNLCEARECTTK